MKIHEANELTIISKRLMRVEASKWHEPETVFQRLQGNALTLMLSTLAVSGSAREQERRVLLLLDCMLYVLDEPVMTSALAFATARFTSIQRWFYGALGSKVFINAAAATRLAWAESFYKIVHRLSKVTTVSKLEYRQGYNTPIPLGYIKEFNELPLNKNAVSSLQPFLLIDKTGVEYKVLLEEMVPVLGRPFTEAFHSGLCNIARPKAKDSALRDFGTTFAKFVAHRSTNGLKTTPEQLQNSSEIQLLLVDFMEFHFMKITRRQEPIQEATLSSLQKLWNRFNNYWASLAGQGVVAAPNAFPAGNPKLRNTDGVAHRKTALESDGSVKIITQKLLLPVPLHVTDEEATQLIFKQLVEDFKKVQLWLKDHLYELFEKQAQGAVLIKSIDTLPPANELEKMPRKFWKQRNAIPLALKYIHENHGGYVDTSSIPTVLYPDLAARSGPSKTTVSSLLGLPSRNDAMALMGFLASIDGRFSESAISSVQLLDAKGKRINAVESDGGIILSILKARDAKDGWHNVTLNGDPAILIRKWIRATEPIRAYMRDKGFEGWRSLFVYTGNPLGAPGYFKRTTNINSAFRVFALENKEKLGPLADQVTIPRIRSTRGVIAFLETMDITAMARELGNSSETSLRYYLPDSIWDYFTIRWIRIFQNLLIVTATKDTPYMQRALNFSTAGEMDEFLKNHALESLLPPEDENTCTSEKEISEIMIPASTGLFTMLLSIVAATEKVESHGKSINAQAIYWREFTRRLTSFIESNAFHDHGIKQMLATATSSIEASYFEEIVCE